MLHISLNSLLPAVPRGTGKDGAWGVQAVMLTAPPEVWCSLLQCFGWRWELLQHPAGPHKIQGSSASSWAAREVQQGQVQALAPSLCQHKRDGVVRASWKTTSMKRG